MGCSRIRNEEIWERKQDFQAKSHLNSRRWASLDRGLASKYENYFTLNLFIKVQCSGNIFAKERNSLNRTNSCSFTFFNECETRSR